MYDTLVLSGGSTKGILLLGALHYLHDSETSPISDIHTYIGVSAGGFIAALLCIGYTPIEIFGKLCISDIMDNFKDIDFKKLMKRQGGAYQFKTIGQELEKLILPKVGFIPTLRDLYHLTNKKLIMLTYNYTRREKTFLSVDSHPELSILDALQMTSALPFVFEDMIHEGQLYIDGGLLDNFPIDLGDSMSKSRCLGVSIDWDWEIADPSVKENVIEFMYNLFFIPAHATYIEKISKTTKSDIIKIKSNLKFFNLSLTMKQKLDMFSTGLNVARDTVL